MFSISLIGASTKLDWSKFSQVWRGDPGDLGEAAWMQSMEKRQAYREPVLEALVSSYTALNTLELFNEIYVCKVMQCDAGGLIFCVEAALQRQ